MFIIRFLSRSTGYFIGGMVSFFLLLVAGAAVLCLLGVGLACAVSALYGAIFYMSYLVQHDPKDWHAALQAILWASGFFGFIVLTFGTVMDLWMRTTRKRTQDLSLEFAPPSDARWTSSI